VFFTRYCKHDNLNLALQRGNDDEKKEMEIKLQVTNFVRVQNLEFFFLREAKISILKI